MPKDFVGQLIENKNQKRKGFIEPRIPAAWPGFEVIVIVESTRYEIRFSTRFIGDHSVPNVILDGTIGPLDQLPLRVALDGKTHKLEIYTAKHCQLVLMALKPHEEIGAEIHSLDQFFRVEEGTGEAVIDGVTTAIHEGFAIVVPAGTRHNIINTGGSSLKLYTLYAPPNHRATGWIGHISTR